MSFVVVIGLYVSRSAHEEPFADSFWYELSRHTTPRRFARNGALRERSSETKSCPWTTSAGRAGLGTLHLIHVPHRAGLSVLAAHERRRDARVGREVEVRTADRAPAAIGATTIRRRATDRVHRRRPHGLITATVVEID